LTARAAACVTWSNWSAATAMREQGELTTDSIIKALNVSRAALYRNLAPVLDNREPHYSDRGAPGTEESRV
jgi:hypothetical protein